METKPPGSWFINGIYLIFAFCSALFLGALKAVVVGPFACLILVIGNVGLILGYCPEHVAWTVYTIVKTNRFDEPLKLALLLAFPALFGIWLGLTITGSVIVAVGYGFFTPWVLTFEAFRLEDVSRKLFHCIVDGTRGTINGSCLVVQEFAEFCSHSYPLYLKELRESPRSDELKPLRFIHVPACIIVGLMGLVVEIPLYTAIAIVKSPYMLFKGWFRLIHDIVSLEGPFPETACIPVAGLAILLWPIAVVGSIVIAIFSSFFIGIYGSVVVYQERSFWSGVAFVVAMVAEFDEYTNDWLYIREGTILPKPVYRKKRVASLSDQSDGSKHSQGSEEAPAMFMSSSAHTKSVREALLEVRLVQLWGNMMSSCEIRGRYLLDTKVITTADLQEWLEAKNGSEATIIGVGLPSYSVLQSILHSIKVCSSGILLLDNVEITQVNKPQDKLLDWFFSPVMVLKEQLKAINLEEGEVRFLEKLVLFGSDAQRMEKWENGDSAPQDVLRAARIQGICRRMVGMVRSVSKFPTYRRRFRLVVKTLFAYSLEESSSRCSPMRSAGSVEIV